MSENPTVSDGASITERIAERISGSDQSETESQAAPAEDKSEAVETPETEVETATDAQAESEEPQISLSDLAHYLGVDEQAIDVDEEGNPFFKTKIDGKEGAAKFADLVKSYQLQGHVDAKVREAAEQAKALQERVQQFEAYTQAEAQKLTKMAQIAQQELLGDFGNLDWAQLARTMDPSEYLALQAQVQTRANRVQQLMEAAQQQAQQAQQNQTARFNESLNTAAQRIATEVDGWAPGNDVDLALNKYAQEHGFTNTAEIVAAYPQAALIWHKAMLYDQGKAKASVVEKKVRLAPKLVKPGQSVDAREKAQDSVRGLKEQIRKSGGKKGITEYLIATGKV